jgi:hypothetical protein
VQHGAVAMSASVPVHRRDRPVPAEKSASLIDESRGPSRRWRPIRWGTYLQVISRVAFLPVALDSRPMKLGDMPQNSAELGLGGRGTWFYKRSRTVPISKRLMYTHPRQRACRRFGGCAR